MALSVEGEARQSFSAVFALQGRSTQGSLTLSTPLSTSPSTTSAASTNSATIPNGYSRYRVVPLGTVLAELQWAPGHAELRSPQGERTASSLDELLEQALGSAIPVQALFAWLHGDATTAAGWQADLSRLSDGQLTAVRSAPLPRATLRIALDR